MRQGWVYVAAGALGVAVASAPMAAHAQSEKRATKVLTDSALMLSEGETKVGITTIEYGLLDEVQINTSPLPWLVLAPNLGLKLRPFHVGPVDITVAGRFLYANSGNLILREILPDTPPVELIIAPIQLAATFHPDPKLALSIAGNATVVTVLTEINDANLEIAGGAATTTVAARAMLEWRFAGPASLVLRGRYLIAQHVSAGASASVRLDDFTRLNARADGNAEFLDLANGFQVTVGTMVSWDDFNLRTGVGYGNFVLPIVDFWTPVRGLVPELDFYWQF